MIVTTDGNDWVVKAQWFGEQRIVFRGSLTACLGYAPVAERESISL